MQLPAHQASRRKSAVHFDCCIYCKTPLFPTCMAQTCVCSKPELTAPCTDPAAKILHQPMYFAALRLHATREFTSQQHASCPWSEHWNVTKMHRSTVLSWLSTSRAAEGVLAPAASAAVSRRLEPSSLWCNPHAIQRTCKLHEGRH